MLTLATQKRTVAASVKIGILESDLNWIQKVATYFRKDFEVIPLNFSDIILNKVDISEYNFILVYSSLF